DTILAGLDVLVSAKNRMRFTSQGRVVFEMALVRLCRLEHLVPLSQLAEWVAQGSPAASGPAKAGPSQTHANSKFVASLPHTPEKKKVTFEGPQTNSRALTAQSLETIWQQVLSEVGFILAGSLRKAQEVAL